MREGRACAPRFSIPREQSAGERSMTLLSPPLPRCQQRPLCRMWSTRALTEQHDGCIVLLRLSRGLAEQSAPHAVAGRAIALQRRDRWIAVHAAVQRGGDTDRAVTAQSVAWLRRAWRRCVRRGRRSVAGRVATGSGRVRSSLVGWSGRVCSVSGCSRANGGVCVSTTLQGAWRGRQTDADAGSSSSSEATTAVSASRQAAAATERLPLGHDCHHHTQATTRQHTRTRMHPALPQPHWSALSLSLPSLLGEIR